MASIEIAGRQYDVIDSKEYMTIPDCFVFNKIGIGHGEAKFYVGNENQETLSFFNDFNQLVLLLKSDLINYLKDAKNEYFHPEQNYTNKTELRGLWDEYSREIEALPEMIEFKIYRVNVEPPRVYINSDDKIYELLRRISLPQISYLSALKLRDDEGKIFYYFRPFIDYFYFGDQNHPAVIQEEEKEIKEDTAIKEAEKEQLIKARIGQGKYREDLLKETPFCLITGVSDERILVASHIKPWAVADIKEKIDPKNGFILTPTFDKLFDRGFISFEDDGELIVSHWLSPMNQKRLGLQPGKKYKFDCAGRNDYLKYHKENIFKG